MEMMDPRMRTAIMIKHMFTMISFGLVANPCFADVFQLKTGEQLTGTLKEFKDGRYVVDVGGMEKILSKDDVVSISTSPAAPQAEVIPTMVDGKKEGKYSTPEKTFMLWKDAAIKGDVNLMASCYLMSEKQKKALKKIPKDKRKEMSEVTKKTEFVLGQTIYQGNRATLETTWSLGLQSDTKVLQFTLDGKDWKIVE